MITHKVCMLGSFAVGKTSLVRRFVESLFDERYHTTVGVKVDRKDIELDSGRVRLMLWDLAGQDEYQSIRPGNLAGAAGSLLVVDPTRPATLDVAMQLQELLLETCGEIPFLLAFNKCDLRTEWQIDASRLASLEARGWRVIETSARSGFGVEEMFRELARELVARKRSSDT